MREEYQSWIPTNQGKLNTRFIGIASVRNGISSYDENLKEYTLSVVNTDAYTDTTDKSDIEYTLSYDLIINTSNIEKWEFSLSIYIDEKNASIIAKGDIEDTGIIIFSYIHYNFSGDCKNIPNTIFTIIKNYVHGDNHHSQKVDVIIPVLKKDDFKYYKVLEGLSSAIKTFESDAKRKIKIPYLRNVSKYQYIAERYYNAEGFLAYYSTFNKIFEEELLKEDYTHICPQNIVDSMASLKNKINITLEFDRYSQTTVIALIALYVSLLILTKNSLKINFIDNLLIVFIVGFGLDFRYQSIGILHNIFKNNIEKKEIYQRKYLYKKSLEKEKYKNRQNKGSKKFYYLVHLGRFIFTIMAIGFLALVLAKFKHKSLFDTEISHTVRKIIDSNNTQK